MSDDDLPPEKTCPDCDGAGSVAWRGPGGNTIVTQCSGCGGTGTVLA